MTEDARGNKEAEITDADWQRTADAFTDLSDPSVMDDAWR